MPPNDRRARLERAAHAYLDVRDAENALIAAKRRLTSAEGNLPATSALAAHPAAVSVARGEHGARGVIVVIGSAAANYTYTVGTPA